MVQQDSAWRCDAVGHAAHELLVRVRLLHRPDHHLVADVTPGEIARGGLHYHVQHRPEVVDAAEIALVVHVDGCVARRASETLDVGPWRDDGPVRVAVQTCKAKVDDVHSTHLCEVV